MNDNIKAYIRPGVGSLIIAVFLALMSLTAFAAIDDGELGIGLFMLAIFLLPALGLFWSYISSVKAVNKFMSEVEASGAIEDLRSDFNNGVVAFKDNLRFGNTYVIGKHNGEPLTYQQITKIYQYEHRTNGATDRRELRVVDSFGRTRTLCKLPTRGANPDDLMRLFAIIKTKNPSVHLGYK